MVAKHATHRYTAVGMRLLLHHADYYWYAFRRHHVYYLIMAIRDPEKLCRPWLIAVRDALRLSSGYTAANAYNIDRQRDRRTNTQTDERTGNYLPILLS